eukprot:1180816-Prorocentrum_minimum.AAC.3
MENSVTSAAVGRQRLAPGPTSRSQPIIEQHSSHPSKLGAAAFDKHAACAHKHGGEGVFPDLSLARHAPSCRMPVMKRNQKPPVE